MLLLIVFNAISVMKFYHIVLTMSYNPFNYYLVCWGGDEAVCLPAGSVLLDQHHAAMCAPFTLSQTGGERFIV